MTFSKTCIIIIYVANEKQQIMWNSVTVARQTLTLFVGVRIPIPQPTASMYCRGSFLRGVAQFGSAHRSGRWSRKFESCHLDHPLSSQKSVFMRLLRVFFFIYSFIWFSQYFAMKKKIQAFNDRVNADTVNN